jgi:hypothetical protein
VQVNEEGNARGQDTNHKCGNDAGFHARAVPESSSEILIESKFDLGMRWRAISVCQVSCGTLLLHLSLSFS